MMITMMTFWITGICDVNMTSWSRYLWWFYANRLSRLPLVLVGEVKGVLWIAYICYFILDFSSQDCFVCMVFFDMFFLLNVFWELKLEKKCQNYRKDTEPLYHAFTLLLLLSSIYPFTQWHSLLVTIICTYHSPMTSIVGPLHIASQ